MRKFFLIPLLSVLCTVMAFATVHTAGTFAELQSALAAAANGDEIQLTADINYGQVDYTSNLNITKSITLNGQGHTLTGAGQRQSGNGNYSTIWINFGGSEFVDVTIKDIKMINPISTVAYSYKCVETRGKINSVTMQNVELHAVGTPISVGGNETTKATFVIENCKFVASTYHPIIVYNPIDMTIRDSYFEGWASIYFKGYQDSKGTSNSAQGARGSEVKAFNTTFNSYNSYSSGMNGFGTFVCEDDGIAISLENCATNSLELGSMNQAVVVLSAWAPKTHRSQPVTINVSGDNSYINGKLLSDAWSSGSWINASYQVKRDTTIVSLTNPLTIECTGGTYPFNPAEYGWLKNATIVDPTEKYAQANIDSVHIPDGYEVKEIETQQGDETTTLYRVRKEITTSYSINEDVEGEGAGQNENTEFLISANETVAAESTIANYVEVSNNATLTLPEGKKLEVTNGLDVTDNAKLVVEAGSTLIVGEGGVTSENAESIVISADENGSASFLLDPEVIVNTTPNLTVEMKVSKAGKDDYGDYWWHRFAMPVGGLASAWQKDPNYGTYLYGWNYTTNDWEALPGGSTSMQPWTGYTLTYNQPYDEDEIVTYTFQGNLVGNTNASLNFKAEGYQFFGNSYTGYIDVLTLINELTDGNIDKSVWMWNPENQTYTAVPLDKLSDPVKSGRLKKWQREVAPMQTFIMRLRGADSANETVNYASAIWGNPRYGHTTSAPAPRRLVAGSEDEAYMEIVVTAANGQSDRVDFTVNADRNDAFENGYDASKYMNERHINLYAAIDGEEYTSVATNAIEGKTINLQTRNDVNYTISFENVEGDEYALRDNATNKVIAIEEGTTYEFAAQPNSTVEGRFEVIRAPQVLTGIENAEVKANAKGIYSMTGIYMGEDFNALPAGVYVVDGVKIVK